jgi:hypothetical protein
MLEIVVWLNDHFSKTVANVGDTLPNTKDIKNAVFQTLFTTMMLSILPT